MQLPAERDLLSSIFAVKGVQRANEYLSSRTNQDRSAPSFLELQLAIDEPHSGSRPERAGARGASQTARLGVAIERNVRLVAEALLRELWRAGYDIDEAMLHEMVYHHTFATAGDVAEAVVTELQLMQGFVSGLLVVPLLNVGLRMTLSEQFAASSGGPTVHPKLMRPGRWAVLTPTRGVEATLEQLNMLAPQLGLTAQLGRDGLAQLVDAYRLEWLTRNPLLLVALPVTTGDRSDSASVLLGAVRRALHELTILSAAESSWGEEIEASGSTRALGERPLRHLDHVFVVSINANNKTSIAPRTIGAARVWQEQIEIGADVPREVANRLTDPLDASVAALSRLWDRERQLAPRLRGPEAQKAGWATLRRWIEAASFFRRSLQTDDDPWVSRISLSSAFELLLLDHQVGPIAATLQARARALLSDQPDGDMLADAVRHLYRARNYAVHEGSVSTTVDLRRAQRAFALCFLKLAARSEDVGTVSKPLAHFTNVTAPKRAGVFARLWEAARTG